METLNRYKKLLEYIKQNEEIFGDVSSIVYEEIDEILYECGGEFYDLSKDWYIEDFRNDENRQYWYWQFDQDDEYALYVEGIYDSWCGDEIESDFQVGKLKTHTMTYVTFSPIDNTEK